MKLLLVLAFFSFNAVALDQTFYCESEAILKMNFMGSLKDGKLASDIIVDIEDSAFFVKLEDVKEFWNKEGNKGHEFGFLVDEKTTNYWIDLQVIDSEGKVSTDYRGITLDNNNVYCEFKSLL